MILLTSEIKKDFNPIIFVLKIRCYNRPLKRLGFQLIQLIQLI